MIPQKRYYALVFELLVLAAPPAVQAQRANPAIIFSNADDPEDRVRRFEANAASVTFSDKDGTLQLSLSRLMQAYKIPGLSIAIIDNFQVVYAKGYGVIAPGSTSPVTTKTLFQAGSISKPLAATAALFLVEYGTLALNDNVNDQLKSWKVPDNEYTRPEKVTLRRILSHTAGLTIHGFPGYDVDAPLPTVVQILNGQKPANTELVLQWNRSPWQMAHLPGNGRCRVVDYAD
jgi:CubicO group peptidase (beta-lactamase class C family)